MSPWSQQGQERNTGRGGGVLGNDFILMVLQGASEDGIWDPMVFLFEASGRISL